MPFPALPRQATTCIVRGGPAILAREHAMSPKALSLALGAALLAFPALAQSSKSDPPPVDLKPLLPPILPPILPPNSYLTPGQVVGDPVTPYSSTPGYDYQRSAPATGFRFTIPTR
jgi:hypothetical protein